MKKIITLLFLIYLTAPTIFGQKVNYNTDSRWFWTFNAGATWQSADVKFKQDWGWGLTIGKSFNYNYGKLISFDLRGRFLSGDWYGQNTDTTNFALTNKTLSSGSTNYKDSLGFAVLNHHTIAREVSLELVLHANALRERTGWDPYIFGGIGITGFKTNGNLKGVNDSLYAYNDLTEFSQGTLNGILDGTYETTLDGSTAGQSNIILTPSLGFGLGYQALPRFSLGIEHKTTFTRIDHFDGYNNPTGQYENDWYHYTSAYLRFHIKKRTPTGVVNTTPVVDPQLPPEVIFTDPSASGTTVTNPNYTIKALVKQVNGRDNVNFRQNGNYLSNFSYNANTDRLESHVILVPGQNMFEIIASNVYGTDQKSTIIIYRAAQVAPPVVQFLNPAANPQSVSSPSFNLSASVLNVIASNQIAYTVNGQTVSNFNFNPANGSFTSNLNLTVGTNVITLTGTNASGSDTKTTTLIYNPVAMTVQAPVVYFVDPNKNPFVVQTQNFLINADVLNVTNRENISFKQNGNLNQNFTFNTSTNDFQSSVVLVPGQNVFEIIASNNAGVAQATTIIIYEKIATLPPVVTITNPAYSPATVEGKLFNLNATILNVQNQNQVYVSLNGQSLSNFTFNAQNGYLNSLLSLNEGNNTVLVRGTNNDGTDAKTVVIIYRKTEKVIAPIVNFSVPSASPHTSSTNQMAITASVLNVETQQQINVNVNGANISNFSYNNSSKLVNFTQNLIEGANIIVVTATNSAGVDTKSTTVIYRKADAILPPVISFIDPLENPKTVFNGSYNLNARVLNISSIQNLSLKINGVSTTNFTFSPNSNIMSFNVALINGANIFEVTATNSAGQDIKSTTIIYKKEEPLLAPQVIITTPFANPYATSIATKLIEATILNVENQQNIQVQLNNVLISGFSFNNSTKKLNMNIALNEGQNTLFVSGTNAAGQASDTRTIIYKKEMKVDPPFVSYVNPSQSGSVVNDGNYAIKANILNIENTSQVVVSQNGQVLNPALYSYNVSNKDLTLNTSLSLGNNIFTIQATNQAGNHSATTNIIFRVQEKPCEKPVITFINPAQNGGSVTSGFDNVKIKILNVSNANEVQLLVNGITQNTGSYNANDKIYSSKISYTKGQNTLEVIASNSCGVVKGNSVVTYIPVGLPCESPIIQLIQPINMVSNTEDAKYEIRAAILNIKQSSDIIYKMNGQVIPFTFNDAQHILISTVNLNVGLNIFTIQTSNDCGSRSLEVKLTRLACEKPTLTINNSSVANGSSTIIESVSFDGSFAHLSDASELVVTQNGKVVNKIFNSVQNLFSVNASLNIGANKFIVTAKNKCGETSQELNVTRRNDPNAVPPVVQITNPSVSPLKTDNGAFNVQATTQYVTAVNQVSMNVNGVPVNPNFNLQNGSLTYNLSLVPGNNVITVNAANQYGSSTDSKVIIYKLPASIERPIIVLLNPSTCPIVVNEGANMIKGYVTNISQISQVSIKVNGANISNFNPVIANGKLNFQFNVNLSAQNNNINLDITAQNEGGSDAKACLISIPVVDPNAGCMPTVGAVFNTDSKTTIVNSTKDLSNVVLKFHDGTVQKFDGLSGLRGTFSGTGANAGKCIAGVWIKSGCNQSNAGPGYGEWVANSRNISNCQIVVPEDCKPQISVNFAGDLKSARCTSTKTFDNIVLKFVDGQEQKFKDLSGMSVNLSGTGANAGKCIVGAWINSGCLTSNDGPDYGQWVPNTGDLSKCTASNGNNGHGNNIDGNDESNPGQGTGGPNGQTGGDVDDEKGNKGGSGLIKKTTTPTKGTPSTPTNTTTPVKTTPPTKTTKQVGGTRGGGL